MDQTQNTQSQTNQNSGKWDVHRRDILKGSVAALVGYSALAQVDGPQPESVEDRQAADQPTPEKLRPYVRNTGDDTWRQKVLRGSSLERKYQQLMRIDPDNPLPPGIPGQDYRPVIVPNNYSLPFRIINGVKVFHLVAEEFLHEFLPGVKAYCWGYNGHVSGTTIEAVEGDRIRIYLTNKLPVPTSLHPHGMFLPNGFDGVSGLTNPATLPGETFKIEFTLRQHGTFMFHSHHDTMTQEGMGLTGLFIIHPRRQLHAIKEIGPEPDRDFAILLQEWRVEVGAKRPNTFSMEFNLFTMNGKAFPATHPLVARQGQRVRLRFGNLSAIDHHPIHLHGYEFAITAENGYSVPPENQAIRVTSLIPVGRTQEWGLIATEEGDWIFHCHMTHHIMNQMDHRFTNMVGVNTEGLDQQYQKVLPNFMSMATGGMNDRTGRPMHPIPPNSAPMKNAQGPYGPIPFGGMASIFKVRGDISDEVLASNTDPGWYTAPLDKLALPAPVEELRRDGIQV